MNLTGLFIGVVTLLLIMFSRWATIFCEYHYTKRFWIVFAVYGVVSILSSLFVQNNIVSTILSINGYMFLWGIGEIIEQEQRVAKGWFPKKHSEKNN